MACGVLASGALEKFRPEAAVLLSFAVSEIIRD